MYICSVYKQFPRYNLSTEIKDLKFWRFKSVQLPMLASPYYMKVLPDTCKETLGEFTIKHG